MYFAHFSKYAARVCKYEGSRENIAAKTHKQLRANGQGCQTPLWAEGEVSHLHMDANCMVCFCMRGSGHIACPYVF